MPISLSYRDVPKIMLHCLQKYPLLDSVKILLINYKFKLIIDLESIISSWSGSVRVLYNNNKRCCKLRALRTKI